MIARRLHFFTLIFQCMNALTSLFTAILLTLSSLVLIASNPINTHEVFQKAKTEQKNIFIQYVSDWCHDCTTLRDSILSNPYIQSVIKEEYILVIANLAQPESKQWFEDYQITCIPTIQIIDISGNLLVQKTSMSEEELYADLLDYTIPKEISVGSLEMKSVNLEQVINPDVAEYTLPTEVNLNSLESAIRAEPTIGNSGRVTMTQKFSSDSDQAFTVTVGAYSVLTNARHRRQTLKQQNPDLEVFIERDHDKNLYRVNAGRFLSRENGKNLLRRLKAEDISCYIRKLPN